MHTRQGVAEPALFENSARPNPQPYDYERDAMRRAALHAETWADEPLSSWQSFILQGVEA